jgi:membrane protein YqaA with SNARE-associated domain
MEENLTQVSETNELKLNNHSIGFLKETAKWANFLAIMGFIGIGLMVVLAFFMGTVLSSLPNASFLPITGPIMTVLYLLMAVLYFFPVLYLYRFADKMKAALARKEEAVLTDAFMNLKSHYKFIGVLTIVMLSFYALGILFALIAGLMAM